MKYTRTPIVRAPKIRALHKYERFYSNGASGIFSPLPPPRRISHARGPAVGMCAFSRITPEIWTSQEFVSLEFECTEYDDKKTNNWSFITYNIRNLEIQTYRLKFWIRHFPLQPIHFRVTSIVDGSFLHWEPTLVFALVQRHHFTCREFFTYFIW